MTSWDLTKYLEWISDGCQINENVVKLNLSDCNIKSLSSHIGNLKNLQTLYLGYNELTTFPIEICQLKNLQSLNLSRISNLK